QLKMSTTIIHVLGMSLAIMILLMVVSQVIKIKNTFATQIARLVLKTLNGLNVLTIKILVLMTMEIKLHLNKRRHSVQLVLIENLKLIFYKLEMTFQKKLPVFNG